ncbi:MAG: hypothetical protein LH702_22765 [Phormidesmis sp. CAN_BIN44]|nr:hypothetical protein [Phormidesmis sp. CAN_BIN44]
MRENRSIIHALTIAKSRSTFWRNVWNHERRSTETSLRGCWVEIRGGLQKWHHPDVN